MKNIAIYVGTYGKYNSSSLAGAWLNVNDYESEAEFYEACRELHKDEQEPEFMFQDFENMPKGMAGECGYLDQMPDNLRHYFDFSAFARDLFFDFDFVDGFVFDLNR